MREKKVAFIEQLLHAGHHAKDFICFYVLILQPIYWVGTHSAHIRVK